MNTPATETLDACPFCKFTGPFTKKFQAPDIDTPDINTEYTIVSCPSCSLHFQQPRVPEHNIADFYHSTLNYYQKKEVKQTTGGDIRNATLYHHLGYDHLKSPAYSKLTTLPFINYVKASGFPVYKKGGKLLEIGCAEGYKLEIYKQVGWEVQGAEMNEKAANIAKNERDLPVEIGRIEDQKFADNQFDVIVMNMVLEHLYNPFEALNTIWNWLAPGGSLIITIPNIQGIEYKIFKSNSFGLRLPRHITFPTKSVLTAWAANHNSPKPTFYHPVTVNDFTKSYRIAKDKDMPNPLPKLLAPISFALASLKLSGRMTAHITKPND